MIKWVFPSNGGGQQDGFNASGIAIFAGNFVQSVVREVIQNSLDARVDPSEPVRFAISLRDIPRTVLGPAFSGIEANLSEAQKEEIRIDASISEGRDFYESAIELVKADQQRFLILEDANTKGLDGPAGDNPNEKDGGWNALVKGNGKTVKDGGSNIGSFGQGSKAPFAVSNLRTVFYLTKTKYKGNLEKRFQGKSILQSFRLPSGEMSQGTGFFGLADGLSPMLDDQVPSWAAKIRDEFDLGTGTSIFVTSPYLASDNELEDFWFRVRLSVISNFYYAIKVKNLTVEIDGKRILDESTIDDEFDLLDGEIRTLKSIRIYGEDLLEALESVATVRYANSKPGRSGTKVSRFFGKYDWFARVDESDLNTRKVGIARATGMLITRRPEGLVRFNGVKHFDIFVCVTGETGSDILRAFENPEHDKFEFFRVKDATKRKIYTDAYEGFVSEIRDLISEIASYDIVDEAQTSDLNHLFGGDNDDSGGDDLSEYTEKLSIDTKNRRYAIDGESGPKSTKPGGRGTVGGTGKRSTTGGNIPGEGDGTSENEVASGIPIPTVRFIVDQQTLNNPRVKVLVRIRSSERFSGVKLAFNKVGEVDRQILKFSLEPQGDWLSKSKSNVDIEANKVKDIQIYIDKNELKYGFEAVVSE